MLREETGQRHIISVGCEMNAKYYFLYKANEIKENVRFAVTFAALQWEFVHFILYFDTFFILNYKYNWQKQTKHAQRQRHHKKMARKAMILQNLMGWFCGLQSLRSNKRTAKRN